MRDMTFDKKIIQTLNYISFCIDESEEVLMFDLFLSNFPNMFFFLKGCKIKFKQNKPDE